MALSKYEEMTTAPVSSLILKLSVPTIISMLVTNIYNLVDTAFVGTLGTSASGAVGVVFGFMSILQAIGFMFGQGAGSILSRKLGAQDEKGASEVASTAFITAFCLAIIAAVICFIFLDPLVYLLGSTKTIAPYAKTYISYILVASPFLATSFTLNNFLRYEGKAKLGMIGMMTGALLNIGGDALFMFGLKMGIAGAGLSTAISQVVSFCILISMFLRGKTASKLSFGNYIGTWAMIFDIMSTGFPSLLRQGLNSLTTVVLNYEAAVYGDAAVAAMSIVSRISFFTFSIAVGIGQGFQPVSGFNYGAKKYDRLKQAYVFTYCLAEALLLVMCVLVLANSGNLIQIFRDDETVIEIGTRALRLQALSQVVLPFCMVTEMLYQSTGHKAGATFLSATRSGLFFLPCLIIFAACRGLSGIQEAQPVATLLSLIPALILSPKFFKNLNKEEGKLG